MRDLGSREYASGEVVLDSEGVPQYYVVAAGDAWDTILDRIPSNGGLWPLNCYRITPGVDFWPGDIINLNPATITSVGSYHGESDGPNQEVKDSCLKETGFPPQR